MYNGDLGDRYTLTTCTSSFINDVESKIIPKSFLVNRIVGPRGLFYKSCLCYSLGLLVLYSSFYWHKCGPAIQGYRFPLSREILILVERPIKVKTPILVKTRILSKDQYIRKTGHKKRLIRASCNRFKISVSRVSLCVLSVYSNLFLCWLHVCRGLACLYLRPC